MCALTLLPLHSPQPRPEDLLQQGVHLAQAGSGAGSGPCRRSRAGCPDAFELGSGSCSRP